MISKPHSHEELEKRTARAAAIAATLSCSDELMNEGSRRKGCPNVPRRRKSTKEALSSLGPTHSKRVHHARTESSHKSHDSLCGPSTNPNKRKRRAAQNDPIASKEKLSMALRFFAGGDNCGISGDRGAHTSIACGAVWEFQIARVGVTR